MEKLDTLEQVAEALTALGYEAELQNDGAVFVKVGGSEKPFTLILTTDNAGGELVFTCQLGTMGDIQDEKAADFMLAALDANTITRPYAFAIISDSDDPSLDDEEQWPIILTDTVPLGDLSADELNAAMDSLWAALAAARPVLETGLGL